MFSTLDLTSLTAVAVYAVLWGFIFAETGLLVGFLLPGDTILFGAGLLAGSPDSQISLPLLITGTFIAAVAGNEVGYSTGKRFGRSWLERRETGRALEQLRRTERFYERYGWVAVVVARWIPWVRTFTPVVAGTALMNRRAFTAANMAGALPWAVGLPLLGYFAYQLPVLRSFAYAMAALSIVGSLVAAAVMGLRNRRRRGRATPDTATDGATDQPVDAVDPIDTEEAPAVPDSAGNADNATAVEGR